MNRRLAPGLLLALTLCAPEAYAKKFVDMIHQSWTCTQDATADEYSSIRDGLLPTETIAAQFEVWYKAPAGDLVHDRLRYLSVLGMLAWSADRANDQALRAQVVLQMWKLAGDYARDDARPLFRVVRNCAAASLIHAYAELDEPDKLRALVGVIKRDYASAPLALGVDDWPLLQGLRALALVDPSAAADGLGPLALARARALEAVDRERASRLYAAVAHAAALAGGWDDARQLAYRSVGMAPESTRAAAGWRVFPALSRANGRGSNPGDDVFGTLQRTYGLPAPTEDSFTDFEIACALGEHFDADAEQAIGKADVPRFEASVAEAARQWRRARDVLVDSNRDFLPIGFVRHGWKALDRESNFVMRATAQRDPAQAEAHLAQYAGIEHKLAATMAGQNVAAAREQLFFNAKIDRNLDQFWFLHERLPARRAAIAGQTFALAQLRSYGRLTLATLHATLAGAALSEADRWDAERFFVYATRGSAWLEGVRGRLAVPAGSSLPSPDQLWQAAFALQVTYSETGPLQSRYLEALQRKVPALAHLLLPRPQSIADFQKSLRRGEVLVATVVTDAALYVWAISPERSAFQRVPVTRDTLYRQVQTLRRSLAVDTSGGRLRVQPFAVRTANELYGEILAPVANVLAGADQLVWYGHDLLGSIPLGALVSRLPPGAGETASTAAELSATGFVADDYAISVLADLTLFLEQRAPAPSSRRPLAFLGVALGGGDDAPGVAQDAGDWARGFDAADLGALDELPETGDEVRAIASALAPARSTLLLGADASKRRLRAEPLRDYRVLSFATHGFRAGEIAHVPDASLLLAPDEPRTPAAGIERLLTSREIAQLGLDADLVILSACNTATSDGRPRAEALTGLSQAFFLAGARALMVTHWSVVSAAATDLSTRTVRHAARDGTTLAAALRTATREVRAAGRDDPLQAHPAYWAPFVVVGSGAERLVP